MSKRLNIVLRDETVAVLHRLAVRGSRSRFIDRAVRHYAEAQGWQSIRDQLRHGYGANAARDQALADAWQPLEEEAWRTSQSVRTPKKPTRVKPT